MSSVETQASLLLNNIQEIGPARFGALLRHFGSAEKAIQAGADAWKEIPMFDPASITHIKNNWAQSQRLLEKDQTLIQKMNIRLYIQHLGPYPERLRHIAHPPPVLYVWGDDIVATDICVALVGSRRCSYYGEKMARRLSMELAENSVTTVSGLARGIDTHVHKGTLEGGGKTWAVIGSGLAHIYPPENKKLAEEIVKQGALISEFPMDTQPFPGNFPRRNRIIAGISQGTVVVEGGEKSGSLITARLAAEEGRDVFAVPGPVTSDLSVAPNRLLQMGAILVQTGEDIFKEIGVVSMKNAISSLSAPDRGKKIPETYQRLLQFLGAEPLPKEILAENLNMQPSLLSSLLLEMELKGLIRSIPGGGVLRT